MSNRFVCLCTVHACGIVTLRFVCLCTVDTRDTLCSLYVYVLYGTLSFRFVCLCTVWTSGINTEITVNGQKPESVTSFKYLGSVITDEGCKPEILSRRAQTTAALTRLKPVWNDRSISLSSKIRLMSHPSSCIFLNHGPSHQSSKEEYKPCK